MQNQFAFDERYWKNFVAIMKILKKHKKRLRIIFNEFGEAPYVYTAKNKIECNDMMKEKVKKYVQESGFTYIKVDVDDLSNSFYFDHDHLNNNGNSIYSARLANYLKMQLN